MIEKADRTALHRRGGGLFLAEERPQFPGVLRLGADRLTACLLFRLFGGPGLVHPHVDDDFRVQRNSRAEMPSSLDRMIEHDLRALDAEAGFGAGFRD